MISDNYNFFSLFFDINKMKIGLQKNKESFLLDPEVISSQFGVVNLEQDVGIADGGSSDLKKATTNGVGKEA